MIPKPKLVQAVTIVCLLYVCLSLPILPENALVDRDTSASVSMNPQSNNAQDLRHSWDFIPSSGSSGESEPLIHGTLHVRASDSTRESSTASSSLSPFIKQETPSPYIAPTPVGYRIIRPSADHMPISIGPAHGLNSHIPSSSNGATANPPIQHQPRSRMDLFRRDDKLLNFLDLNPSLISPKTKADLDNFKLSKKTFQKVLVEKNFCHSTKMLIDQWRRDTKGSREGIELMTLARHITSNSIHASPEAKGLATTLLTLLEEQSDQERYLQDCEYYDNALKTQRAGIEYHQLLDLQLRTVAFTQVRSKMTSAQLQEMIIDQERYSQFIINSDQSTPDEKEVARKYLKLLNESKVPEEPSVPSNHGSRRGSLGLHHDKRPLPVDSDDDNSITVGASNPKRRITRASGRIG